MTIHNADVAAAAALAQSKLALNAWSTYNPAWTSSGTQPDISNGVLGGRYVQIGKTVHGRVAFWAGSSTTFGTGYWIFTLPVSANASGRNWFLAMHGSGYAENAAVLAYSLFPRGFNGSTFIVATSETTGAQGLYAYNWPFTWGSGDYFRLGFTYEAA